VPANKPGSIRVGRLLGVDLNIHWSLSLLLVYVVLISAAQFPYIVRQSGFNTSEINWNPVLFGLAFAIGLFTSVVVHELGHVFVAQRQGVKVKGITLMMLGGMSEMGQVPDKPYAELKLAVIGPIISLVLSAGFWMIHQVSNLPNLSLLSYWLSDINLALAIFNLIPALPLDGGRVLRSFLAAKQGTLRATESAVKVSHVFAWVLGLVGFLQLNFFLILIAFFVYTAAQSELMLLMTKSMLKGICVGEATTRVESIAENSNLHHAVLEMLRSRNQVLPVRTVSGAPRILTLDSIRKVERGQWVRTPVKDVMDPTSTVLDVNDPVNQAMIEMATHQLQALPVQENGELVGILKYSELSNIMEFKSLEELDEKKVA